MVSRKPLYCSISEKPIDRATATSVGDRGERQRELKATPEGTLNYTYDAVGNLACRSITLGTS
jgi:hypothetical protein